MSISHEAHNLAHWSSKQIVYVLPLVPTVVSPRFGLHYCGVWGSLLVISVHTPPAKTLLPSSTFRHP